MRNRFIQNIEGKILNKKFRQLKNIFLPFDICEIEIQTNNNSKRNIELYGADAREINSYYKIGYNIKVIKQFLGDYMLVRD